MPDAAEALNRAYQEALMAGLHAWNKDEPEVDPAVRVLASLDAMTHAENVPFPETPWVCFNTKTGELGRAYEYRGEHRIRVVEFGTIESDDPQPG